MQAGRIKEAYDALRAATRLEPTAPRHYIDLATICLDHENYDLGLEIVEIGLRSLPRSGTLHIQRGVLLVMKGLFTAGRGRVRRGAAALARERDPDDCAGDGVDADRAQPQAVDLLRAERSSTTGTRSCFTRSGSR